MVDSSKTYRIYTLSDPQSDYVKYVGMTSCTLDIRLLKHLDAAKYRNYACQKKNEWVLSLYSSGVKPTIELIDEAFSENEAIEKEKFYIKLFKSAGAKLLNKTNGGRGLSGYKQSKESIERARSKNTGVKRHRNATKKMTLDHYTKQRYNVLCLKTGIFYVNLKDYYSTNGGSRKIGVERDLVVFSKSGKSGTTTKVINTITGQIFDSVLCAYENYSPEYRFANFSSKLRGEQLNDTPYLHLDKYQNGEISNMQIKKRFNKSLKILDKITGIKYRTAKDFYAYLGVSYKGKLESVIGDSKYEGRYSII